MELGVPKGRSHAPAPCSATPAGGQVGADPDAISDVQNERQARALAPDGTVKRREDLDPVEQAMHYLVVKFEKLNPNEKHDFIDYIRKLLGEMESRLKKETSPGK